MNTNNQVNIFPLPNHYCNGLSHGIAKVTVDWPPKHYCHN